MTLYVLNSLTYLTEPIENGYTIVYLSNVSGFVEPPIKEEKGFIFWNYTDSTGYIYSPETYSRNIYSSLFEYENIDFSNNTITLNKPWDKGYMPVNTKLSQSSASSVYNYGINFTTSLNWTCKNNIINPSNKTAVKDSYSINNFRFGTQLVLPLIIFNYDSIQNSTIEISRSIFRENDKVSIININMDNHEPLRSVGEVRDYIDYKSSKIVRLISSSGAVLTEPTYEDIELPTIPSYKGNTVVESIEDIKPILEAYN